MRKKQKGRCRIFVGICFAAVIAVLFVVSSPALAQTVAGTTSRNSSKYDFNCFYTLTNDTVNKQYTLKVTAQLKIRKYKFSTTKAHKVNIEVNGKTYTKALNGLSGGDNASTVTKPLYSKSVNFPYASAACRIPVSISTTDISSGGYGPGICKASTSISIPAVTTMKTVSGSVVWKDHDNQDGLRSPRIITIKRDGAAYTTRTTDAVWSASVPVYKADGGTSVYTVTGDSLAGYAGPTVSGFNLTYTRDVFHIITVSGTIQWNDCNNVERKRPDYVTVSLLKNGKQVEVKQVTEDQSGNWSYRFTSLPENEKGKPIVYTVAASVSHYETKYNGWNIINTCIPEFGVRLGFSI